jgi:two-component system sensor histidine kinase HydH
VGLTHVLVLAAGATYLALALFASRSRTPLGLPLGLFSGALFAYCILETVGSLLAPAPHVHAQPWEWLESAAATCAVPPLLHFLYVFVGAPRRLRRLLWAAYAIFGVLGLSCLLPVGVPALEAYPGGPLWAGAMLAGLSVFVPSLWVLVRHGQRTGDGMERARTQLLITALVVGLGTVSADLGDIVGLWRAPNVSGPGLLVASLVMTALTLRFRLLEDRNLLFAVNALLLGGMTVFANLLVFRTFGEFPALLVLATLVVTLVALLGGSSVYRAYVGDRERSEYLATLGRLSAQMAHDIRNPLASVKGAAQYLEEEARRGAFPEASATFVTLLLEESERLERVIDRYQRLGRAQGRLEDADVDAMVARLAESARLGQPRLASGEATLEIDGRVGVHPLDLDLVEVALENLLRNALESGARTVTLRVGASDRRLELAVVDDGPGMDARTRARARRAFFTTKSDGTGLGLAFARRVAEAHGGRLDLQSALGRGTTVRMSWPTHASEPGAVPS